jgi:putative peptidoglycan lipid II flippase
MIGFSIVVVDDWYLKREGTVVGAGAAATLSYAKTLMKVPMGVFGLAAGVAVFPTLQRLVAGGDVAGMRATLLRTLRNLLVISFAAQAVLTVCGDDIVALIYGRTRLDPEQVHEIAVCLTLVSIGLAAWAAQTLIARGFYALGNTWMPALLGTVVAAASYPLYVLAREHWGVRGLAVASSGAIVAYTLILFWRLDRRLLRDSTAAQGLGKFMARALVVLAAGIGAGVLIDRVLPHPDRAPMLALHALVLALAVIAAFALAARAVGLHEVSAIGAFVRRRR